MTERAATLEAAVAGPTPSPARRSSDRAGAGAAGRVATVLLSPAAASFDMFVDYAARGRAFKAAVGGTRRRARRRRGADEPRAADPAASTARRATSRRDGRGDRARPTGPPVKSRAGRSGASAISRTT